MKHPLESLLQNTCVLPVAELLHKRCEKPQHCYEKRQHAFVLPSAWVQTALATCMAVCSLRGLSCVFWQLLCHVGSPVNFPPHLWDHRRWGAHLCSLRNTLAVTRRWFTNFCGGFSWISRSPKLEGMLNVLGHFGRKAVTGIQTFAISSGRRVLFRQSGGRDGRGSSS